MANKKISKKVEKEAKKEVKKLAKKYPLAMAIVAFVLVAAIGVLCLLHYKRVLTIPFLEGVIPQEEVVPPPGDPQTYTLTVNENDSVGGSVTGGGTYEENETATLVATPNSGYVFQGWYNGSVRLSTSTTYSYVVTSDATITARFAPIGAAQTDALEIYFLELGNANTGDCTLIKVGDTEVLIDAGSLQSSATHLNTEIAKYCTDGKLEYVVATHMHTDHVGAFVGTSNKGSYNGIMYTYDIGTIISFSNTAKTATPNNLYGKYLAAVEYAVSQGAVAYKALDCVQNANGAQSSYTLGEGITFNILYQKYYEVDDSGDDENNYSVCTLLSQGDNHYLFTGDLESEGEESLLEENTLPQVKVFKAGHHGSPTSTSSALLEVIRPEIVCVCCCCGNMEYTDNPLNDFPSQAFVDRVAPYTDKIYVTSITDGNGGFTSYNGNIVVSSNGGDVTVNCSNNNTIFRETQWFRDNRTWPQNGVNSGP